ncbi:UDP-glucose:(heptosyl) LPS alpha1,3-glucosyltransferase WaaG [Methylophaga frappieri]|uniref:UDP-glucose:(Heptosyl) LPS alpha1,3-glucosyltransferase WaaG n=1 Tax=Methylophaga frappieri (strain ATCC BAA-2434 / DSM 25690 / JAM7) TaxID=754477 RepID=I1YKE1_METFJ|nr:glycosyltransferase family 4 protein [Methylophaga frappieri]AFJ03384.1 UDP-glucose:(heptosyl) LPS alpha1,3-glucosyltransferase WaaG [Methylophaga frappieri]
MQLAFAITEYFPFGGAQRDFIAVAKAMAHRGHQITVITAAWQGDFPCGWQKVIVSKAQFRTNHARLRALSDTVLAFQENHTFDAIIGFTKMAGLDIYFAADPSFVATRYHGIKKCLPRYRVYAQIEQQMFANKALKVFFLTQDQRLQYQRYFSVAAQNQQMLPVTVEPEFHYDPVRYDAGRRWRQEHQPESGRQVLLFVAADFHTKGLDRVIRALQQLSSEEREKLALWIVGNGKQAKYDKALAALTGLHYTFWGGQTTTHHFYFAADVLVHPARKEAAGMVIAEALAARLPVRISSVCGYRFLAEADPASRILPVKNRVAALAQEIRQISRMPLPLSRGQGGNGISRRPRADFCADQIEAWLR